MLLNNASGLSTFERTLDATSVIKSPAVTVREDAQIEMMTRKQVSDERGTGAGEVGREGEKVREGQFKRRARTLQLMCFYWRRVK